MRNDRSLITRREAIAALASTALFACSKEQAPVTNTSSNTNNDSAALSLLDDVGNNLLKVYPERATSLGIDTGARAALRSLLSDRAAAGQQQIANHVPGDMQRISAFNAPGPSSAM